MPNPFQGLDDESDFLTEAPAPGLIDRFKINFEAGNRQNTIAGATFDAATEVGRADRARFDRRYESYPEWQGILEGGAALAGQIAGTAASPENFIPVGLGEKILVAGKQGVTGLWAKVFAGAVDAAASNAVTDAAIQGIDIAGGNRQEFDPVQYGAGILLGAAVGGAAGAAGKALGGSAPEPSLHADNPFAGLDEAVAPPIAATDNVAAPLKPDPVPETIVEAPPAAAGEAAPAPAAVASETIGERLSAEAAEARGLAIPPEQVQRVVDANAPVGKPPARPQSLMDFLASEGGIRDDAGELANMGVSRKFLPGRGALVRGEGMELDKAREAAAQAGYFNHLYGSADEATAQSTVRDLLDLVDQEARGKPAYSMADADRVKAIADHDAAIANREDYRRFVDDMAKQLNDHQIGVTVDDAVLARAADLMVQERLSPLEAFDRSVLEDEARFEASLSERGPETPDAGKAADIPFFDDVEPGRAAPAGRDLERAGGEGASGGRGADEADRGQSAAAGGNAREQAGLAAKSSPEQFLQASPTAGFTGQRVRAAASAAKAATGRVERVRETAEALAKALDVAATRQGRTGRGSNVLGTFDTRDGVVRVRSLDDFDTLSHEYGHHLDAKIPEVKAFIAKNSKALALLDYDPAKGRDFEGFAEFFRLWLTNRAYVQKNMPAMASEFDQVIKSAAPDMAKAIDAATDAWDAFLKAPSSVAVRSTIVSAKKDGWVQSTAKELRKSGFGGTIAEVLQRIYTFAFDDLNPINRGVSYLKDLHYANTGKALDLKVSSDPYKLARMSRGSYSAGHMDIMYGVAPYRGTNPASPSLRDAIIEATGKPNALSGWDQEKVTDFGSYLWSRRALGEWERYRNGDIPNPPDKLTEADHAANVAEHEKANPRFVSAADKVHQFGRALWKKKYDAGLIDQETYDQGLLIKDYVPGLRDFSTSDTDLKSGKPGRGGSTKGGLVKRFKGSKRDVINPLESMAADAYETAMTIARNDVVKSLHRLALNAGLGGGRIAEIVPVKELRASMIDPIEAVQSAAKNAGLSAADITVLRDAVESAVGSEKAAIFRPAIINEKGEPIVFFRDGGDLKALRLADGKFGQDMYKAITGMSPVEKNFWLELVAMPARVLRAGITLAPEFIGANFIRDQTMAAIFYGKPLQRIAKTAQGAFDDLAGTEVARSYSRMYGISGGAETSTMHKLMAERDLSRLAKKGWATRLTSPRKMLETTEIAETATRVGLFRTFKDEAKKRGLSDYEAMFEAAWRARDYMDFDRRGSGMAALAKVIPFLNASMQGLDKASRHMIAPLARKVLGQAQGPEDAAAAALAAKSWARLAALVTGSISLYALQAQHEDHDEISETTRSTHWMIKTGEKWTAIPKPFEMAVAINLGEAMYDSWVRKDPAAAGRWLDSLYLTVAPPSLFESNPLIKSYFELRTNTDLFTDAPIVPDQLKGLEPWLQYTARTSAMSKQLGYLLNEPPVIIDHLIVSHLGSLGRGAVSLYDLAQPDAPGFAWDDAPVTRRFIKDASRGSMSGTKFWDLVGEREGVLEGKVKSWKMMAENGDAAGAADYFASLPPVDKAYVAVSSLDADARRLHPMIRARGGIQAIGTVRRELAAGRIVDGDGNPVTIPAAARTAADDILSTLSMAMARNGLKETGVAGWAQRSEIDENTFYRELEAVSPALAQRLGDAFATNKVWSFDAVKQAWPELKARALSDGSSAFTADLVADVKASGLALDGEKRGRKAKPELVP